MAAREIPTTGLLIIPASCGTPSGHRRAAPVQAGTMNFSFDEVAFVTADTHFGHARIIELAERPFATLEQMDAEMIRRWNQVVSPDDVVLHLGDLALGPLDAALQQTSRLNGRKLLVPGNHDRVSSVRQTKTAIARFTPYYQAAGWNVLPEHLLGTRHGRPLLAAHYPYATPSNNSDARLPRGRPRDDGLPLIHGHTHARDHGPHTHQFHVGVDATEFAPLPFTAIDDWLAAVR